MTRFRNTLATAVVVAFLAGLSGPAEANDMRVRIPFRFFVNGKERAPGVWTVSSSGNVPVVRGAGDVVCLLASHLRTSTDARARLVLERHGDRYFLAEVWMADAGGYEANPSRGDRELGRVAHHESTTPDCGRVIVLPLN